MTAPLREVMQYRKQARGWRLALECAHLVVRRYVPRRARCVECVRATYSGPLFNWPESRDTLLAWSNASEQPIERVPPAAG